jgi:hypothetical protein
MPQCIQEPINITVREERVIEQEDSIEVTDDIWQVPDVERLDNLLDVDKGLLHLTEEEAGVGIAVGVRALVALQPIDESTEEVESLGGVDSVDTTGFDELLTSGAAERNCRKC